MSVIQQALKRVNFWLLPLYISPIVSLFVSCVILWVFLLLCSHFKFGFSYQLIIVDRLDSYSVSYET